MFISEISNILRLHFEMDKRLVEYWPEGYSQMCKKGREMCNRSIREGDMEIREGG